METRASGRSRILLACVVACAAALCIAAGAAFADDSAAGAGGTESGTTRGASGDYLYAAVDDDDYSSTKGLWGFVDASGAWVIGPQFADLGSRPGQTPSLASDAQDGRAGSGVDDTGAEYDLPGGVMGSDPFPAQDGESDTWGYIDRTGAWVIQPQYSEAHVFSDGLALVRHENSEGDDVFAFVDASGDVKLDGYDAATSFTGGYAFISGKADTDKDDAAEGFACIDKNGDWALKSKAAAPNDEYDMEKRYCYESPVFFHEGLGFARIEDGQAVYIDEKGNEAVRASSGVEGVSVAAAGPFNGGVAEVEFKGGNAWEGISGVDPDTVARGLVTTSGTLVKAPDASTSQFSTSVSLWKDVRTADGLIAAQEPLTGMWGYVDAATGEWKIAPRFADAYPFSEGLALARDLGTGDYGYIDEQGAWKIAPRFFPRTDSGSAISFDFTGGLSYSSAELGGNHARSGWVNQSGSWIVSWE